MRLKVQISIVTYDSDKYIEPCLHGLERQTFQNYHVSIVDNCSKDSTVQKIRQHLPGMNIDLIQLNNNIGFAAAHNIIINTVVQDYSPSFICVLNPDVFLNPDYIERVLYAFERDKELGSATGKLIRVSVEEFCMKSSLYPSSRIIDSTGIFFTPTLRHWDRGLGTKDVGQFEREEYIWGVSGAAAIYRTEMLEDIKIFGEYFDEGFFAYREDADLSWRAQICGWRAAYVPSAIGLHVRQVVPGKRKQHSSTINMHSVKNRFLMRIKNMDLLTCLKCLPFMIIRDIQVVLYVLIFEKSSIAGFRFIMKNLKSYLAKRREIFKKRRVGPTYIASWFNFRAKTTPILF